MANSRICSIPDCGKLHYGHTWCRGHYDRWHRHGDPLGGRTSKGEANRYFREVVMVHTTAECLIWPFLRDRKGYGRLDVDGHSFVLSRLVCESTHGAPPTPQYEAAHSCGKGSSGCVSPLHLSWKTRTENERDKTIHGTHSRGERSSTAILTEADVHEIRALRGKESGYSLARRFSVKKSTIYAIHAGTTWAHIPVR